jgi:glycogen operon protein
MSNDPVLNDAKLIVEPWDIGLGGWQTGNFPDRFSEWNDSYRDSVRRFWLADLAAKQNSGHFYSGVADLATRLAGSRDIVDGANGPLGSVNFVTAHDGFCLHDLVSYNVKHNQVNGEGNRDGNNNNYSYNHGAEGEVSDLGINALRRRSVRNMLGTLLFSAGVPMITAGDERAKTQSGNNNAYCQDTALSWVNWNLTDAQKNLENNFTYLTKLRRENASLRQTNFGNFETATPDSDMVRWYSQHGEILTEQQWHDAQQRTLVRQVRHVDADGSKNESLTVLHGDDDAISLTLPPTPGHWELIWDSTHETPPVKFSKHKSHSKLLVGPTSMLVFRAE